MDVSYNTIKKHLKKFGIFDQNKNPFGVGISKKQPVNPNSKRWKYFDPHNVPKTKGATYWIGLDTKDVDDFMKKWKCNPIKVGKADCVVKRTVEVLEKYYPQQLPKTKMWEEWLEKAKPQGWIHEWTKSEASKIERALHNLLKQYKMKNTGKAREVFDISWD